MKNTHYAKTIAGRPVVNAKRRIKLTISPMDTKAGKKGDPKACAAARAILREIPNCVAARVHVGRVYLLKNDGNWHRYKTPDALRTEIVAMDRGGKFEPGDYELIPVAPSDEQPYRKAKYGRSGDYPRSETNRATLGNSVTKQPRKVHVTQGVRKGDTIYR